jgi:hypothetical protein
MTEFKFACPVCGQHITADTRSSGQQLDCPTCFQKIVVPQGPSQGETKLILSASQAAKPRPNSLSSSTDLGPLRRRKARRSIVSAAVGLAVVGALGATLWVHRGQIKKWVHARTAAQPDPETNAITRSGFVSPYPVPTNSNWTLDLVKAVVPETQVSGCLSSNGFFCEKATLQGGNLFLAQGNGFPADLGIAIGLLQQGPALNGKTILILANRAPPVPLVVMRWKDERDEPVTKNFTGGYALQLSFGQPANGRIPGRIYIALPDEAHSFAAGTFEAELQKISPRP